MKQQTATMIGLLAIVLWSTIIGMIKVVSQNFGTVGGGALIYSLASVFLLFTVGLPQLRSFPRQYLIWGSLLFVSYEICLALSIGYTSSGRQAIEVGMINYLWPTLTILASIFFNKQRTSWWIILGIVLSMFGISWVLGGESGLSLVEMTYNITLNPLSYGLALLGAILWAGYCVVTAKYAVGKNGVTFFFILVSIALWIQYFVQNGLSAADFDLNFSSVMALVFTSAAIGFGYVAWNIGILRGNVITLATASYFTPILSMLFASMLLGENLSFSFWQGVLLVCLGSICCFISTKAANRS